MKSANPDLVFMVSYVADAILLMRQARELALSPKAFVGGGAGFSQPQFWRWHSLPSLGSAPPVTISRATYEVALDVFLHSRLITRRHPYEQVVVPPPEE